MLCKLPRYRESDVLFCSSRTYLRVWPFCSRRFFTAKLPRRQFRHGKYPLENLSLLVDVCIYVHVESAPKLNDFTPVMDARKGREGFLTRQDLRQVACGSCSRGVQRIEEYLAGSHVTGRRRDRRACLCQDVRHGINGSDGGPPAPMRQALFRRKGDEARNYGFAFIGSRPEEGPYLPRMGEGRRVFSGLLGIMPGILEHMLSASCSLGKETSTKVIDCLIIPKNMRMALLFAFRSHRSNNCAREECERRKSIVINSFPLDRRKRRLEYTGKRIRTQ